jgi:hypothetical protein
MGKLTLTGSGGPAKLRRHGVRKIPIRSLT